MSQVRAIGRRLRLRVTAPIAVVVAVGAVLTGSMLASASPPDLPHRTPAQLLAGLRHATVPPAMTAVVVQSANLGLPALPDVPGMSSTALSWSSLVAGSHTIQLWYSGPRHVRIALPVSFGETDLRVNGDKVWLWDSQGQKATRYLAPARPGPSAKPAPPGAQPQSPAQPSPQDPFAAMTPIQAAQQALALAGKTTRVTVAGTVEVAGRPAYQLAIAPRSGQSLIGRILIAIDASTHLPLDVQVFARGAASPALHIGFTSLTLGRPATSNFDFTPPPGARVRTVKLTTPANWPGLLPNRLQLGSGQLLGAGWLTVAAIHLSGRPASSLFASHASPRPGRSEVGSAGPGGTRLDGSPLALLLRAAKPVHGHWGAGRLLRTGLFSALITSDGQILVGAVRPSVLYADVGLARAASRPK